MNVFHVCGDTGVCFFCPLAHVKSIVCCHLVIDLSKNHYYQNKPKYLVLTLHEGTFPTLLAQLCYVTFLLNMLQSRDKYSATSKKLFSNKQK